MVYIGLPLFMYKGIKVYVILKTTRMVVAIHGE